MSVGSKQMRSNEVGFIMEYCLISRIKTFSTEVASDVQVEIKCITVVPS